MLRHFDELLYDLIGFILKVAFLALAAFFVVEVADHIFDGPLRNYVAAFLGLTFGSILPRFGFRLP